MPRPEKVRAGCYRYRERWIIRTTWEGTGPRGGTRYLWELGDEDEYGDVALDGFGGFRTMGEAIRHLDAGAGAGPAGP